MDASETPGAGQPTPPDRPEAALPGPSAPVPSRPDAPTIRRKSEAPIGPDASPTITFHPAASGIAEALGPAIPVLSGPEDFIHELTESGLMEPAEASAYRRRFSEAGGLHDARAVSRELVRCGRLTPYQAAAILQGKTRGLIIGSYLVLDRLGAGSMGIVLKAEHRNLRRVVALKLLPPSLARDPSAVIRFRREAKAAARLGHPNVVSVLDADEFRGLHFLVMEYVVGTDLARLVKERGPMEIPQAVDCIIQAARGLKAVYEADVVHRDIKPSNLLLEPGGNLKILDMGVARLGVAEGPLGTGTADASLTESNVLVGTVDYMAPEQASNPKLADHRSDIYSLGCTLHYLLTGRPPFSGETVIARLFAHREQAIPTLSDARPDVPRSLDPLFRRMMSKSPMERVSSLDELISDLEACLADPGTAPAQEPTSTAGPEDQTRFMGTSGAMRGGPAGRRRVWWLAGAAAGVAAIAGLVATTMRGGRDEQRSPETSNAPIVGAIAPDRPQAERGALVEPRPPAPPATPPATVNLGPVRPPMAPGIAVEPATAPPPAVVAKPKRPARAEAVGLVREFRGHEGRVNGVAVSADGSRLISGGQDHSLRLWHVDSAAPLLRLDHDGPVTCVAMTPDGLTGLSGSLDRTVRVWDLRPDRAPGVHRMDGHTGPVFAVAFGPDARRVFSGGGDRTVRIWDPKTGRPDGPPLAHESAVVALAAARGGGVLAGCDDGTIWQWDLKTRQRLRHLSAPGPVLCLALAPDGHRAISGHPDGLVLLWNLDLGTQVDAMSAHGDYVRCAAFTPDGSRALTGSQRGILVLWDLESRREIHRFARPTGRSAADGQVDLAILADGLHALTAETDGAVRLWRLPDPAPTPSSRPADGIPTVPR